MIIRYSLYGSGNDQVHWRRIKNESQDLTQRDRLKNGCESVVQIGDLLLCSVEYITLERLFVRGCSYHMFLHWYNRLSTKSLIILEKNR